MGNPFTYGETAVAFWRSGRKEAALKMMEKLNEHGTDDPVSFLIERIAEAGDRGLAPMLQKIADAWDNRVGDDAQSAARRLS